MTATLAVQNLSRRHGTVQAASGVSFEIAAGEIVGLLGPNGAGKTTIVECILGLLCPDEGRIEVCGRDARLEPERARASIGAVLQATGLQDKITPREALELFATFHAVPLRSEQLLAQFGLTQKTDAAFETLSGGQKQRLSLALAFVGNPPLFVLDEPTTGLDPHMRREVQDHIRTMKNAGHAVLLATHDMEEAAQLCDRVAVMAQGRIVAMGKPHDLIATSGGTLEDVILQLTGA